MTDYNAARTAARHHRRQRTFTGQCCVLCGFTDPRGLVQVPREKLKAMLEQHHVVGRINDRAATLPLCRNCHSLVTAQYFAAAASMFPQPTLLHKIMMVLRSLATFFPLLGAAFSTWAEQLEEFIGLLDEHCPTWRKLRVRK